MEYDVKKKRNEKDVSMSREKYEGKKFRRIPNKVFDGFEVGYDKKTLWI